MNRIILLFFFLSATCLSAFTQVASDDPDELFDDAEYFFSSGDYKEALYLFLKLTSLKPDNANYNFRTGMTYLNLPGQETNAIPYLEKAVMNISLKYKPKNIDEKKAPHHSWFYLGNAYRINNDLEKALDCYERFKSIKDFEKKYNIRIVDAEIKVCERAKIIKDSPLNLVKTNLGPVINAGASDYAPVVSANEDKLIYMSSQKFYEAIMYSTKANGVWSTPVNITSQIGSDGEMMPTSLNSDGTELYLVKKDNNNSDIYFSKFDGNLWSKAVPLNKNINSRSNETFASISHDGKNLYFTSDRSGTFGGLDIFVSKKQSVGDWGVAENLGSMVNTEFDEETPHLSKDGKTLYFSSKGHFNMGGFDVFYSAQNNYNQFDKAVNAGFPVNTTNDDFGFFPLHDGKIGYMSLFDENHSGNKDIFRLEILPFTEKNIPSAPKFSKDFKITLTDIENSENIDISYDIKSDQVKVKSSKNRNFKAAVE